MPSPNNSPRRAPTADSHQLHYPLPKPLYGILLEILSAISITHLPFGIPRNCLSSVLRIPTTINLIRLLHCHLRHLPVSYPFGVLGKPSLIHQCRRNHPLTTMKIRSETTGTKDMPQTPRLLLALDQFPRPFIKLLYNRLKLLLRLLKFWLNQ